MLAEKIRKAIVDVPDFPQSGVMYKDITPIFLDADLCLDIIEALADFSRGKIDVVCGIESRGFLFGMGIANRLKLPFVLVRKKGKLPGRTISQEYALEYGEAVIEINDNYIEKNSRVLIHDDVLATGGTAEACAKLVEKVGAIPAQFSFLAKLNFLEGDKKLKHHTNEISYLVNY